MTVRLTNDITQEASVRLRRIALGFPAQERPETRGEIAVLIRLGRLGVFFEQRGNIVVVQGFAGGHSVVAVYMWTMLSGLANDTVFPKRHGAAVFRPHIFTCT